MKEDLLKFPEQLKFLPQIENKEKWQDFDIYVLSGMGGSHLQGDVLKAILPEFPLFLHQDYGLPFIPPYKKCGLVTASYSGNTEEALDSFEKSVSRKKHTAVISKGGELLQRAKEKGVPYIKLPQDDIQPRIGLGYSLKALLKLLGLEDLNKELKKTAENLAKEQENLVKEGERTASLLAKKIPVVYSSTRNEALARLFKINFNETTKIPAFYNVFPELNHNEMNGYDPVASAKELTNRIHFVFLVDREDHPRNLRRMEVLGEMLKERGMEVLEIEVKGKTRVEKIFSSILLSGWIAYYLSYFYGSSPEGVPMVEEFKKKI